MNAPRQTLLACAALVVAVFAAYRGSLGVPFHFDDGPAIVDNPTIRTLWPLARVLSPPADFGTTVNGRPLVNLSLALNYAVGGTAVRGYHLVNLAIHALATLALFGLVRRVLICRSLLADDGSRKSPARRLLPQDHLGIAFAIALLWSLHPLQTESVTYVIQRAESLAALFYLLTLYCFARAAESLCHLLNDKLSLTSPLAENPRCHLIDDKLRARPWWQAASIVCCLAGFACKETVATAPLMALLLDRTFFSGTFREAWQRHRVYYCGLAATWLGLIWLVAASGARGGTAGFGVGVSPWSYALTQCQAVVHYLRLAFWPQPLVFDYGMGLASGVAEILPQALVLLTLLAATVVALRRWPAAGFAGAWFFVTLAPSSSFVPIATQTIAEHRMYLPLAAVVALVVVALFARLGSRSFFVILPLATALGVLTARRNSDYASPLTLWRDTVAKIPANARAQNNLGKALVEAGDVPGALICFKEALRLLPDYPETHNNLGYALAQSGQSREAVASYERALQLRPTNPRAHDNLGNALLSLNRVAEAVAHFDEALRLRPDFPDAHWGLGNALVQSGRSADAIAHYETALRLDPTYADAHYGLAVVFAQSDRAREAISHYEEALRLKPAFPEAENNLGNLLFKLGQHDPALARYRAALRLKPDYAEARVNLANALVETGHPADAIAEYRTVLRAKPSDPDAHFGLGSAFAQTGRMPEAIAAFRETLSLKPDHVAARANLGNALLVTGHATEAVREFEEALRLSPDDRNLRASLDQARQLQGAGRN